MIDIHPENKLHNAATNAHIVVYDGLIAPCDTTPQRILKLVHRNAMSSKSQKHQHGIQFI